MGWITLVANQQQKLRRWKKSRVLGAIFLCCICFFLFTPKIPLSSTNHRFADLRNLLGLPNTLNVITNFPFLVVGVLGLVLALEGGVFNISSQGEVWAWVLFYAGITGVAFGSAYYHLKPDNNRILWDTLPLILPLAIAVVAFVYRSNYTHSRYWFWSAGIYLLAKFEAVADRILYRVNNYIISGHSLEHLCLALIPILFSIILIYRELKFQRLGDLKDRL